MDFTFWPALVIALEFGLRLTLAGVILLRQRPTPASTLAWIMLILIFPVLGLIFYLLIGEVRLGRDRIRRHAEIVSRIESATSPPPATRQAMRPVIAVQYQPIAALGEAVSNNRVLGGNSLELISNTDAMLQRLIEDIDAATKRCHLHFYIYLADGSGAAVGEALTRAAERGVECRLLVDAVGSRAFLKSPLRREMEQRGVQVVEALPASILRMAFARVDLRNHRKIVVIDDAIAYTGSQNIADADFAPKRKYAPWVDVAVRIRGPITRDLEMLFIEDWYLDTNESLEHLLTIDPHLTGNGMAAQIMGTGPNAYNEALRQLTQSAFHSAREELILTTPYFVPDEATAAALRTAAHRGVDTRLVVPARNDSKLVRLASRSYYESLLDAGVKLYEFQDGLLHAKTMTIDRDLALVSTANLDRRSFELNFEVSLLVYDTDFASQLRFLQTAYIDRSTRIHPSMWKGRSVARRLLENAVGILSPLL